MADAGNTRMEGNEAPILFNSIRCNSVSARHSDVHGPGLVHPRVPSHNHAGGGLCVYPGCAGWADKQGGSK